ncbi:hypothetical protein SDC9_196427 [bioreactor metagenome]|uniref:Uncharacterized protein n=1 Tax=bioreactor metagenome TaxID=1076179 RepID=A0A645IC05_9ZZZZ
MAQFVDIVIDVRIFFDVEISARHIGFRLVIIIVRNEIFHGVLGEKAAEFIYELSGKRLVVGKHERGFLHLLNDFGHGKCFAASRYADERLSVHAVLDALADFFDCLRLIPGGGVCADDFKFLHDIPKF